MEENIDTGSVEDGTEDTSVEEVSPDIAEEDAESAASPVDPSVFDKTPFKLVVNGKEITVNGKDLKAAYQRGESGAERLREAAELKKKVAEREGYLREVATSLRTPEGFFEYLCHSKEDPIAFLQKVAHLAKNEASLSEEARELRENKRELEKYKKAEKEKTEKEAQTKAEAEQEAWEDAYSDAFDDGLDELGDVPDDDDVREGLLVLMGQLAAKALEEGEDPYVEDLAKQAWKTYRSRYEKLAKPAQKPKTVPGVTSAKPKVVAPEKKESNFRVIKQGAKEIKIIPSGASFRDLVSRGLTEE